MDDLAQPLLDFIMAHRDWAIAVMFITAFGESFAFLSMLFPGTTLLIAAGALIQSGALSYSADHDRRDPRRGARRLRCPTGSAANAAAPLAGIWPFSRNPQLSPAASCFFERHGGKSVFIGRFFGPVRAVIPLAAGIMQMPRGQFWLANVTSALVWAPMLLFAGDAARPCRRDGWSARTNTVLLVFVGITLFGIVAALWAALRAARSKGWRRACPESSTVGASELEAASGVRPPQLTPAPCAAAAVGRLLGETRHAPPI